MCYIYIILCLDENYTFQIEYCKTWVLLLRSERLKYLATSKVFGQELLQVHKIPFDKYQHLSYRESCKFTRFLTDSLSA